MAFNFSDPRGGMGGMGTMGDMSGMNGMGMGQGMSMGMGQLGGSPQREQFPNMLSYLYGPLQGLQGQGPFSFLEGMGGGTPSGMMQTPLFNNQQQNAFSNILSSSPNLGPIIQQLLGGAQNPQQSPFFQPIANQMRDQFRNKTIPSIAERFSSHGGQRSSAFQNALGSAGAGLESDIGALGSQHGLQLLNMGLGGGQNLLRLGLTPQFENTYKPREPGFGEQMIPGISEGLKALMPMLLPMLLAL
jgi:hypothetical protein